MQTEIMSDWSRGVVTDTTPDELPANAAVFSRDWMHDRPGMVYKRGPSYYASAALTGAGWPSSVAVAPFSAGTKVVAVSESGHAHMYTFVPNIGTAAAVTDVATLGTGWPPISSSVFIHDLMIIPGNDGTSIPRVYDGSVAPTALAAGSAPAVKYLAVWLSRAVGAGVAATPRRVFFSPTPNPNTAWDTANAWFDADYPVRGLATNDAGLYVFSASNIELVMGTTPPPGSNLSKRVFANVGLADARTIAVRNNRIIWATTEGVFMIEGTAAPVNLTAAGGISRHWQDVVMGTFTFGGVFAAGGFLDDNHYYVNTFSSADGVLIEGWMCYLPPGGGSPVWWQIANNVGIMFAQSVGLRTELYMADRTTNRVIGLSGFLDGAGQTDADGDVIIPLLYTRPIGTPGLIHYDRARFAYVLEGGTSQTLQVTGVPSTRTEAQGDAFTVGTLATTGVTAVAAARTPLDIAYQSAGLWFQIAHGATASVACELHSIEVDYRPFPLGMVA